jgi:hypothetical protein
LWQKTNSITGVARRQTCEQYDTVLQASCKGAETGFDEIAMLLHF